MRFGGCVYGGGGAVQISAEAVIETEDVCHKSQVVFELECHHPQLESFLILYRAKCALSHSLSDIFLRAAKRRPIWCSFYFALCLKILYPLPPWNI